VSRAAAGRGAAVAPSSVRRQDAGLSRDARRARSYDARQSCRDAAGPSGIGRGPALAPDAAVGGGLRPDAGLAGGAPPVAGSLLHARARRGRRRGALGRALRPARKTLPPTPRGRAPVRRRAPRRRAERRRGIQGGRAARRAVALGMRSLSGGRKIIFPPVPAPRARAEDRARGREARRAEPPAVAFSRAGAGGEFKAAKARRRARRRARALR